MIRYSPRIFANYKGTQPIYFLWNSGFAILESIGTVTADADIRAAAAVNAVIAAPAANDIDQVQGRAVRGFEVIGTNGGGMNPNTDRQAGF